MLWEMINAFLQFYIENPDKLALNLVLLLFVIILWFSNNRKVKQIIKAKNQEIERLAEDNRKYRELYLTKIEGMSTKELHKISAETIIPLKKNKRSTK